MLSFWILNNSDEKWEADFCGFLVCKKLQIFEWEKVKYRIEGIEM